MDNRMGECETHLSVENTTPISLIRLSAGRPLCVHHYNSIDTARVSMRVTAVEFAQRFSLHATINN